MTRCLVTDRKRLCPGQPFAVERRSLLAQVRGRDAGVELIHVRERDLEAACLAALVADIIAIARGTSTRVVVNDRLDVAMASAPTACLRGDSIPIEAARRPPPRSCRPVRSQRRQAKAGAGVTT